MPDGATPDVRLGDLVHADRRLHASGLIHLFQRILQGEGVDDGAQHAHVVGRHPIHSAFAGGVAANDVAATHHDGELRVMGALDAHDVGGDVIDDVGIDTEGGFPSEALASQLEEHPFVARQRRRLDHSMNRLD